MAVCNILCVLSQVRKRFRTLINPSLLFRLMHYLIQLGVGPGGGMLIYVFASPVHSTKTLGGF